MVFSMTQIQISSQFLKNHFGIFLYTCRKLNFLTNFEIVYQREVPYSYDRKCDKKQSINSHISSSFDCVPTIFVKR